MKWGKKQPNKGLSSHELALFLIKQTTAVVRNASQSLKNHLDADQQSKLPRVEWELVFFFMFALNYWWANDPSHTQEQNRIFKEIFSAHSNILFGDDAKWREMSDAMQERFTAYSEIVNEQKGDSAKFLNLGIKLSEYCDMPSFRLFVLAPDLFTKALELESGLRVDERGWKWSSNLQEKQRNVEATKKKCPYCGQSLDHAAIKCSRCKKWVPNELFDRLCNEDVELIKNNNLTPHIPSLVTIMIIGLMTHSNLEKQVQKALGRRLNGRQRFNLYVFESYCYFNAITLSAKTKRGCRDIIMGTLKDKLWNGIIESAKMEISGTTHEESTLLLKAGGRALYDRFDDILKDLGTGTASQARTATALASAVYGDEQANILNGLPLYGQLMAGLSRDMVKTVGEMFLVEEEDFDWQAMMGKSASL